MVCPSLNPQACWEFEGEILVLHHPTTISSRYQAMGTLLNRHEVLDVSFHYIPIDSSLREHQADG